MSWINCLRLKRTKSLVMLIFILVAYTSLLGTYSESLKTYLADSDIRNQNKIRRSHDGNQIEPSEKDLRVVSSDVASNESFQLFSTPRLSPSLTPSPSWMRDLKGSQLGSSRLPATSALPTHVISSPRNLFIITPRNPVDPRNDAITRHLVSVFGSHLYTLADDFAGVLYWQAPLNPLQVAEWQSNPLVSNNCAYLY